MGIPCRCSADVESKVGKVIQHVTSVKAISSIKAAIHALLSTSPFAEGDGGREQDAIGGGSTPWTEQWTKVCQLILSRELSIWDTFFQPVLLQRVKVSGPVVCLLSLEALPVDVILVLREI